MRHALRSFSRLAALLGSTTLALCGVRGPPRPPLGTEDAAGKRDDGTVPVGCEKLDLPPTLQVGRTTAEICDACDDLRDKRERCGVKEPLGGRCRALCYRSDWKRNLDPAQDVEERRRSAAQWVLSDGGPMEPPPREQADGGAP